MEQNATKNGFSGCAFLRASGELSQHSKVRDIAKAAKRQIRERCIGLASAAGCRNADMVGSTCALLIDGAQALSLVEQSAEPFRAARESASALLKQNLRGREGV
jgi:hypothetical protein